MAPFFPPEALTWLAGSQPSSVLVLGVNAQVSSLVRAGHSVTVADRDQEALLSLSLREPTVHLVAASAESLPFDPCCFNSILSLQNFHTFAPGLALGEWARILIPGGLVGLSYLSRDDSVPWVRKLKRIVQTWLPEAMKGDYGTESTQSLMASSYFHDLESISYRLWVPATRQQLQDQAAHAAGAEELSPSDREAMLAQVGELYDSYARVPDPLKLPYQLTCWRTHVDQSELTSAIAKADEGFSISF